MAFDITIAEQPIRMILESDEWQILIALTGIITAGITAFALWVQIHKQSKVSSANLILELLKPWRDPEFQNFLNRITQQDITEKDVDGIEKFLNQLEDIATFWKDGTLSEIHVKEFFGSNLKTVSENQYFQDYIRYWNDKNPKYYFVNLKKLIMKVDEWKI